MMKGFAVFPMTAPLSGPEEQQRLFHGLRFADDRTGADSIGPVFRPYGTVRTESSLIRTEP